MSNYVRNYVFCSENLYNNFQEKDFDDRLFKSSMYEPEGMKIDDDKYFIVFDTRGMEYKEDLIRAIIYEYRDTIWYCIEENNIEQGFFWFDKNKVLRTSRQLSQACADCILNLSEIERLIEEVCLDNDGYINLDYNRLRDFL